MHTHALRTHERLGSSVAVICIQVDRIRKIWIAILKIERLINREVELSKQLTNRCVSCYIRKHRKGYQIICSPPSVDLCVHDEAKHAPSKPQ